MQNAKIALSERELALVKDAGLILTKNVIMQKAAGLLQEVQDAAQQKTAMHYRESNLFAVPPKISKGENYLGLPYLILDYPRIFRPEQTFAIRSFFWWGRFFSSTLHVDGSYKQRLAPKLAAAQQLLAAEAYFVNTGSDPWAHHFEGDNYTAIKTLLPGELAHFAGRPLPIKIAARWPVESWPAAADHLAKSRNLLLKICFD